MTDRLPGVILAGGRATRMGGGDKGLLVLGGQTLLARVIARLAPQCEPLALSANGDPARFAAWRLPVLPDDVPGDVPGDLHGDLHGDVTDDRPGGWPEREPDAATGGRPGGPPEEAPGAAPGRAGPLAGVLAGLDWAAGLGAPAIVTAAADTPFLPHDLAARLQAAAGPGMLALAASRDAAGVLRRHPTCGLWPVALRADLRAALAGGLRKAGLWAERHGAATAVFDAGPPDPFFNINTPADLAEAERLAGPG